MPVNGHQTKIDTGSKFRYFESQFTDHNSVSAHIRTKFGKETSTVAEQ